MPAVEHARVQPRNTEVSALAWWPAGGGAGPWQPLRGLRGPSRDDLGIVRVGRRHIYTVASLRGAGVVSFWVLGTVTEIVRPSRSELEQLGFAPVGVAGRAWPT